MPPQNFRERVDIASSIKSILDSYPFGNGVLRELLQNSDDAGATHQTFILDEREHGAQSLLDPVLKGTQGPSLLAVNDSVFQESDWTALRTIHGSNKTSDETKIGKYGLGFRSCFHVTDTPHILSGDTLVIFDPQEEFSEPNDGGIKFNFVSEGDQYSDQLGAFTAAVPDTSKFYHGTVVRLPLRTAAQAARSKIKAKEVTVSEIERLFDEMTIKELKVVGLFLKSITSIKLQIITPNGGEIVVGNVKIEDAGGLTGSRSFARGSQARQATFKCNISLLNEPPISSSWRVFHSVPDASVTSRIMSERLPNHANVENLLKNDKLFAHVALAFPLDHKIDGRLFTLLPLPIYTHFPMHLHSILALTPDRQSLRNREETGMSLDSREKFLTGWNDSIFDKFVPAAWAKMLQILVDEDGFEDLWSAWPPPSNSGQYWANLTSGILKEALYHEYRVFPVRAGHGASCVSLASSLVAPISGEPSLLNALARANIPIVQPPEHIFQLLESMDCLHLDPSNVHLFLLDRIEDLATLDATDKNVILDYLLLSPSLRDMDNVFGLPLFPLFNGTYAALGKRNLSSKIYVLASDDENYLFSSFDREMVSLSRMSIGVRKVLSDSSKSQITNVVVLNERHVNNYLHQIFGPCNPALDEVEGLEDRFGVAWLARFWSWMDSWPSGPDILPSVKGFHLLPTASTGIFRKVQSSILLSTDVAPQDIAALKQLGLQFLHPSLEVSPSSFLVKNAIGQRADDVDNIIRHLPADIPAIDHQTASVIQNHFIGCIQKRKGGQRLAAHLLHAYRKISIFPILVPDLVTGDVDEIIGPVQGKPVFVNAKACPLPLQPSVTYVDVSKRSRVLALLIDPKATKDALNEIMIFESAISCLESQPRPLLDSLVSRIIPRFWDLSKQSQKRLQNSRFVPARGSSDRFAPGHIIDPGSELEPLFRDEPGRFPDTSLHQEAFWSVMGSAGFFQKSLTHELALERIAYISKSGSSSKAAILLRLLDKIWRTSLAWPLPSDVAWLPATGSGGPGLYRPYQCRDIKDNRYLFDLVLPIVNIKLESSGLRAALGWVQDIPFSVLQSQLRLTLTRGNLSKRGERLIALIKYMASLCSKGGVSDEEIEGLKEDIGDRPWIPVTPCESVSTRHAVLSAKFEQVGPFKIVPSSLRQREDVHDFLISMGCTPLPALDHLLSELELLSSSDVTEASISEARQLLEHIAEIHSPISVTQRQRILVGDFNGVLRQIDDVYYDDLNRPKAIFRPDFGRAAHPTLSKSLASGISIRFLSSLELGEDDDDDVDDLDMGEDLCVRVAGVLKDYDIRYSLNEFLANAADARASQFSILLDTRSFGSDTVLCPEITTFQHGPSLILHNDAVFTDKDFSGLRRIGKGGKSACSDTIGRFGLGALSLFHFTEVPMLVSGGHIMILDPSGDYLPPHKGRKRTALRRTISSLASKYPDQISVFESLFDFSASESWYNGTLFRLPLRKNSSPLSATPVTESYCHDLLKEQYRELAYDALLFTSLVSITAQHRSTQNRDDTIWSVSATHHPRSCPLHGFDSQRIDLSRVDDNGSISKDQWLITGSVTPLSSVPPEYKDVLDKQKLMGTRVGITVRMALPLETGFKGKLFLFSALRLPVTVSLPVHLHAQFALASDRRAIRFDPPDGQERLIPESAYNLWILSELAPRLYFFTLHEASKYKDNSRWWPRSPSDIIAKQVVEGFYLRLPTTAMAICKTVTHNLIAPENAVFSFDEPWMIRRVLGLLGPANYVTLPSDVMAMTREHPVPTVTPEFLKATIQAKSSKFLQLVDQKKVILRDIETIIQFLFEKDISPLCLPLLWLSSGKLISFGETHGITYYSDNDLSNLFPASRFIHRDFGSHTIGLLISRSELLVKKFDATGVISLVREKISPSSRTMHSQEMSKWIEDFWECFEKLPGPLDPSSFGDLPLLPVHEGREYVSLNSCRQGCLIASTESASLELTQIVVKLGMTVIKRPPPFFSSSLGHRNFSLTSFIESLGSRSASLRDLSPSDLQLLADWVRENFSGLVTALKPTAACLPVWPDRLGRLCSGRDLKVLPREVPMDALSRYLVPHAEIAEYSYTLLALLNTLNRQPMTSSEILGYLHLPQTLPSAQLDDFRKLLDVLLKFPTSGPHAVRLTVPDGTLTLRPVGSLYDASIPLLSSAFEHNELTFFVHHDLRHLQPRLRAHGLKHDIDLEVFLACAREIDRFHNDDIRTAEMAYTHYSSDLPSLLMTNANKWQMLEHLRFIPRRAGRRPHLSDLYEVESYCKWLPMIVAPGELLLQEFEEIAWTQRGVFGEQPPGNLMAVNRTLGVPAVDEVVAHLLVLSGDISIDHVGSTRLLQDIHATYKWLNNHAEEARIALLRHTEEKIFLNLDLDNFDTPQDWVWKSATQLVLNLPYDNDNHASVRGYLCAFRPLLVAAGVHELSEPSYAWTPRGPDDSSLQIRLAFNAMRQADELTDVTLRPTLEDTEITRGNLRAHKAFLAAAVPHFKDGLLCGMSETMSSEYPFQGSAFGACAVLEFIYTGELEVEQHLNNVDPWEFLDELLELLTTADLWDMPDFKMKIGELIIKKKLVMPETYEKVMEHARTCGAAELVESCRQYEDQNRPVLLSLAQESSVEVTEFYNFSFI